MVDRDTLGLRAYSAFVGRGVDGLRVWPDTVTPEAREHWSMVGEAVDEASRRDVAISVAKMSTTCADLAVRLAGTELGPRYTGATTVLDAIAHELGGYRD